MALSYRSKDSKQLPSAVHVPAAKRPQRRRFHNSGARSSFVVFRTSGRGRTTPDNHAVDINGVTVCPMAAVFFISVLVTHQCPRRQYQGLAWVPFGSTAQLFVVCFQTVVVANNAACFRAVLVVFNRVVGQEGWGTALFLNV